jgi:glucan-binding YG repeat protein
MEMKFTMKTTTIKKKLALFTAIIMALTLWTALPLQASADEVEGDGYITATGFKYTVTQNEATITKYTGNEEDVEIPAFVAGNGEEANIPVTHLSSWIFTDLNATSPTQMPTPNTTLKTVSIPASVTSIGTSAFRGCSALIAINVAEDNEVYYSDENGILFAERTDMLNGRSQVMAAGVKALICYPAGKPDSDYRVPDGVAAIEAGGLMYAASLTSITIPNSVTIIAGTAFIHCESLTTITVEEGNQNYYSDENGVLFGKMRYEDEYNTITFDNDALAIVCYPAGKTATSYKIPDGVMFNAPMALATNKYLKEVTIPDSVKRIGVLMFVSSTALSKVTIPDGVTQIDGRAFAGCTSLTSITIPNTVTWLGWDVFAATGLTSITIPDSVKTIGNRIFQECPNLVSVTLSNSMSSLNGEVFKNCTSLESIVIPDSVTVIDDTAFIGCTSLTDVTVPSGVLNKTSGESNGINAAFPDSPITTVTLSDSVTTIPDNAFKDLTCLETVNMPLGVTNINTAIFDDCTSLTAINVDDRNDTYFDIDGVLFKEDGGDTILVYYPNGKTETTYTVPDGVTKIGDGAFKDNTSLVVVTIPDSVTEIASDAFDGCDSLTTIRYAESSAVADYADKNNLDAVVVDEYGPAIESIALNETTLALQLQVTQTATLSVSYLPEDATEALGEVAWESNNTDVATVDNNGNVTAKKAGSATITATVTPLAGEKTATCEVTVAAAPPAQYAVTVSNGTGGGSFAEGSVVTITANAAAEGKIFNKWTTTDGVTFADESSATTSFVMPTKAVTVTATYVNDPQGTGGNPENPATNGWIYENGAWKFFIDGVAQTGWLYDDGAWYYLNADGIMQTGWLYDIHYKAWYYLAGNGVMKTGWIKDNGSWYYLAGNGAMVASKWLKDTDGSWYYLSGNGKMLTGKQTIGGKVYSFKSNGVWIG